MYKTCKSCGTIFDLDESVLSSNIHWLKCSVCNEKWSLSDDQSEYIDEEKTIESNKSKLQEKYFINETEKVKNELASIKSVVEDQTKIMSQKNNPILDIKNKSVAEISSELSAAKVKSENIKKEKKTGNINKINKKVKKKINFLPFILFCFILLLSSLLYFRSALFAYSYFYFPKKTEKYLVIVNEVFNIIQLPVLAELGHIKMTDFVATVQQNNIKFTGIIKNSSSRPILTPRIKILAIREDRKILMEQIIVINDKIIMPLSVIEFKNLRKINFKEDNISIKATILKKMFSN
ncbi:zinc-ribbon domain-containing protein [Alphaproteobacteria bacterium]|nr:zinc-ribbon domain-containing protein [Alphaproteobacteria bacterium]